MSCFSLVYPVLDSLCFLDLIDYFLSQFEKIFDYHLFKKFFILFLFLFFLKYPYNMNVGAFNIVPEVSETILNSFHSFPIFCCSAVISTILSFSSLFHSASDILQLIPYRVFLISVITLFVSVYSLFLLGVC